MLCFWADNIAAFGLEPATIIDLRRSGLCYRPGRRARKQHLAIAVQCRSAGLGAIACIGLETPMYFLFQPLRVPSEAPGN